MTKYMKQYIICLAIILSTALDVMSQDIRNEVPEPIYDGDKSLIELYYKAWEIADKSWRRW